MKVAVQVKVRSACGAYNATLHKHRGSSTQSALIAVERVVGRYLQGAALRVTRDPVCIQGPDERGREVWEFVVEVL